MIIKQKINVFLILSIFFLGCTQNVSEPQVAASIEPENTKAPTILHKSPSLNLFVKTNDKMTLQLECNAKPDSEQQTVSYQWYEGTPENSVVIAEANQETIIIKRPIQKGIFDYYCKVTGTIPENGDGGIKSTEVICQFTAAFTGLPMVLINTPKNREITSKEEWLEDATISIKGATNDTWNFESVKTSIRGRGNTTWGQPKKPYAIKLNKKQKILGLPKHKRWVLIANYLDNSFMRNEMAFYFSETMGLGYTVHGKFIDLILNGEYKGLYWLGEAIKIDENRININEDEDYLIEMDVGYDEIFKFRSEIKNLPYMIKNDDSMTTQKITTLKNKINDLETLLYSSSIPDESYTQIIDIDSWARFWLTNELISNGELGHPKSCYFTYETASDTFKAGPVWDFDWAALDCWSGCYTKNTIYYDALFKSPAFVQKIQEIWNSKSPDINIDSKIEEMRSELAIAAEYDAKLWGVNHNPASIYFNNFNGHVDYLKEILNQKKSVIQQEIANSQ